MNSERQTDRPRVLVATIAPRSGGVPQMTRFVTDCLRARGFEPVLAWYEPYSRRPDLSVPGFRLGWGKVGRHGETVLDGLAGHAIGAWLPELEFTHYWPTRHWRRLIADCTHHLAISGTALAGLPYVVTDTPWLGWIASDLHGDRKDRVTRFPLHRRALDAALNAPVLRHLERRVLRHGRLLALSHYTRRELDRLAGQPVVRDILPMPVDIERFRPEPSQVVTGRIGFVGRFADPRKNIDLLLQALALCRSSGLSVTAELIGAEARPALLARCRILGVSEQVRFLPYQDRQELADRLQTLDLFVLPSHQEGLCIAALEAMACGCPVISTRCGGPEEFVIDDRTGSLIESDPHALAAAIVRLVEHRDHRQRLARNARHLVEENYGPDRAAAVFWQAFEAYREAKSA